MFSSDLEHLRQSGAGKLRRGQRLPRLARASPPRARPAGAHDELGRARRRRLRRAQRTRRRIPRAAGHDGTLAGRSDVAAGIVARRRQHAGRGDPRGLGEMAAVLPRHAGESAARAHLRLRRRPGKRRRDERLAAQDRVRRAGGTRSGHRASRARSRRLGAARQAGQSARRSTAHRSRTGFADGRRNRELARSRHRRRPCRRRA